MAVQLSMSVSFVRVGTCSLVFASIISYGLIDDGFGGDAEASVGFGVGASLCSFWVFEIVDFAQLVSDWSSGILLDELPEE